MMTNEYPKIDVLILDEFHVENPEKYMILQLIKKKNMEIKKLIVVSATMSEYDYNILESCMDQSQNNFCHISIQNKREYTISIEYKTSFKNNHNNLIFNSNYFFSEYDMSFIVKDILTNEKLNQNILIFVQSPDICEKMFDSLKGEFKNIYTIHGQKTNEEIKEILNDKQNKIIIGTNILETSITIPNLSYIIDFGICYSPDANTGELLPRYCSQSEMIQRMGRTGRTCSGKIVRIYSEVFYNHQPYIYNTKFNWKPILLESILNKNLLFIKTLFEDDDRIEHHIEQDLEYLIQHGIICHEYQLLKYIDIPILKCMLSNSSLFLIKRYPMIIELYNIHKKMFLPENMLILCTLVISLLDITEKYGFMKLFYLPSSKKHSYSKNICEWKYIMSIMTNSINDPRHFLYMFINIIIMILSDPKQKYEIYHINGRIWKQLKYRWIFLLKLYNISFENIFDKLKIITKKHRWYINDDVCKKKYGNKQIWYHIFNKKEEDEKLSLSHEIYTLTNDAYNVLNKILYKMIDKTPSIIYNILPYDRYLTNESMNIMINDYFYIDVIDELQLHINELKKNIINHDVVLTYKYRPYILKEKIEMLKEIENEVAYRPGNFKYNECFEHFTFCQNQL
jgi:hypothetical protein